MRIFKLLSICTILCSQSVNAGEVASKLTPKQSDLLNFAYDTAKSDGHQYPYYVQGIIMQESGAGGGRAYRVAGPSVRNRYYGIGQIKLDAAKAVMNKYPDMWSYLDTKSDEELQARLILDDRFNIRVTSKYAIMMGMNSNPTRAITAYNQGLGGVTRVNPETFSYTLSVKRWVNKIKNILGLNKEIQFINGNTLVEQSVPEETLIKLNLEDE